MEPVLRQPGTGRTLGIVGDVYRFLATGDETDGRNAVFEALIPPGGGPPLHLHRREQEGFYVLDGEVTFYIGDDSLVGGPGMFVNAPPGVWHRFRNESQRPARLLIWVTPAGLEKMFFEVGTPLAPDATSAPVPSPDDIKRLLDRAPHYGVEIDTR